MNCITNGVIGLFRKIETREIGTSENLQGQKWKSEYSHTVNHEETSSRLLKAAVVAGIVGVLAFAVAGIALATILGAPVVAATVLGLGLASFVLPSLITGAVVSALSFVALGLAWHARSEVKAFNYEMHLENTSVVYPGVDALD